MSKRARQKRVFSTAISDSHKCTKTISKKRLHLSFRAHTLLWHKPQRGSPPQLAIFIHKQKRVRKNVSIYLSVRKKFIFYKYFCKKVRSPLQLAIGIQRQKCIKKHVSIYLWAHKIIQSRFSNCSGDCSFSSLKQLFSSIKLIFFIQNNRKIRSPSILTT